MSGSRLPLGPKTECSPNSATNVSRRRFASSLTSAASSSTCSSSAGRAIHSGGGPSSSRASGRLRLLDQGRVNLVLGLQRPLGETLDLGVPGAERQVHGPPAVRRLLPPPLARGRARPLPARPRLCRTSPRISSSACSSRKGPERDRDHGRGEAGWGTIRPRAPPPAPEGSTLSPSGRCRAQGESGRAGGPPPLLDDDDDGPPRDGSPPCRREQSRCSRPRSARRRSGGG